MKLCFLSLSHYDIRILSRSLNSSIDWMNEVDGVMSECPRRRRPTGGTEPMSMRRRLLHHHRTHHSVIWYCERDVHVRRFRREDGKKKLQCESKRSHRVLLKKLAGCSWWWPHLSSQHLSQLICNLQVVIEWPFPTRKFRQVLISVEVSTGSRVRVGKFACFRRT